MPNIARYITEAIERSDKTQLQISKEVGFDKPNIITMIKQGKTKVPICRVSGLAKSLDVDPVHLFNSVLAEYQPETWLAVQEVYGSPLIPSLFERRLIEAIRNSGARLDLADDSELHALARDVSDVVRRRLSNVQTATRDIT